MTDEMANEAKTEALSATKRALYELRAARARIAELERAGTEPIAIVGMALRFPGGAVDTESLWRVLDEGRDAITEIPIERWDIERFFDADADAPGKMTTRRGGFVGDVDRFDAAFFGISPREAVAMDPQQRLLLEVAWEALENAGQSPDRVGPDAGVFVALSNGDYGRLVFARPDEIDVYSSTGNNFSIAAGRLSYFLGLQGPSIVVDTACSGSLVAIHLASQSLRRGECRVALAGGANLILTPEININFSKARMMASDGRCKTFDAAADGYVRGEGVAVVVLKRLSDAVADGDPIHAVIRGSAVNQDGRSAGLTVPSGPMQEAVIRQALAAARIEPAAVGLVEAHGTGTSLGDPIEAHALAAVFGPGRTAENPLVIGSIKTNVGHLEAAAGVAGLIKAVLALEHEQIPAHLHFKTLNPHIDWRGLPVQIPVTGRPWPRGERPRIAGISSFGFGGTNAHVIIEEAPVRLSSAGTAGVERPTHLLALSARTPAALDQVIMRFQARLDGPDLDVADLCHSANLGRAHGAVRTAFLAASQAALRDALTGEPIARGSSAGEPEIAFLFTGQGAQWPGMGQELYDTMPVFRAAIDDCARILTDELDRPLLEILFEADQALIDETVYAQPALFALQWALAQVWESWGVRPAVILGHSVGEYVAMCVAGVWSLEDGLALISERGRLTHRMEAGWGMAAVQCDVAQVAVALDGLTQWVAVAAANGPTNVVVSGRDAELDEVLRRLSDVGIQVKRLSISRGFHSPQMDQVAIAFGATVAKVEFRAPRVPLISSVTGRMTTLEEISTAEYWRRQVRNTVLFQTAMETLAAAGHRTFVEVGPHPVLIGMGRLVVEDGGLWVCSLKRDRGAWEQFLDSLGHLYVAGTDVDWAAIDRGFRRKKISLPTYPFERQRYWLDALVPANEPASAWNAVQEAGTFQASQLRLDLDLERYRRGWDVFDRLTGAYIVGALAELGAFQGAGEVHSVESLAAQAEVRPEFQRLLGRWLARLAASGQLRARGDCFVADLPLARIPIEPLLHEADEIFGPDRALLDYVRSCGSQLPEYLTGRLSTLESLFPGGTFERAESIYQHAPLSAYFAGIGRAVVEAVVRARRGARVRAVEIGAGTGSTTAALLPVLAADDSVYHFTDVSDFFLNHARGKFAKYPFVRFGLLDAEKSGAEQGFADGSFDVVVATNVVHATRDLRVTLRNVGSLLAPGGILILCEVTQYLPWFDITTGLIEGWQSFTDGLRDSHPLLPAETWLNLLADTGFERSAAWPEPQSPAAILGQHVLVAQAPDVPRRQTRNDAPPAAQDAVTLGTEPVNGVEPLSDLLQLAGASTLDRHEMLIELVRTELARVLRVQTPGSLQRRGRLTDLGVDSLMAVELRGRLTAALHLDTPLAATLVFDHPSIEAVATHLEHVLGLAEAPELVAVKPAGTNMDEMSDDEAEALLLLTLQSL